MLRLERRHQSLAPSAHFAARLGAAAGIGIALIIVSLGIGMVGYRTFESLTWTDAFLNASMILSGMGPASIPDTDAGKVFAGLYALYSGFAVLVSVAIIFAPVLHRGLHRFHLEDEA